MPVTGSLIVDLPLEIFGTTWRYRRLCGASWRKSLQHQRKKRKCWTWRRSRVWKLLPQTIILLVLELPPEFPVIEENKNEQARVITCQYVWMYLMGPHFLAIMITCFGIHLSNFCLVVILSTRLSHQVGAKRWITKIGTSRFSEPCQDFSNQRLCFFWGV